MCPSLVRRCGAGARDGEDTGSARGRLLPEVKDTKRSAGRDPADAPAYTVAEAAALVRVPASTLRSWVHGRSVPTSSGATRRSGAVIRPAGDRFLSFTNVVEAHVLAALRREHEIELTNIRAAVRYVETKLGVERPLARERFKTDGVDLFVERLEKLINASRDGQTSMREVLDGQLRRVEYAQDRAVRFFPLHRPDAPRVVVVDPLRAFGRPVIDGTSVPIADVLSRFQHGDPMERLALDFGVAEAAIEEAIRAATKAA